MEVDDLFTDLADGKKLLKLLEIISGERLAKPNNGRMRVHKIENVNKSLAFLHTKVSLIIFVYVVFVGQTISKASIHVTSKDLDALRSKSPLRSRASSTPHVNGLYILAWLMT